MEEKGQERKAKRERPREKGQERKAKRVRLIRESEREISPCLLILGLIIKLYFCFSVRSARESICRRWKDLQPHGDGKGSMLARFLLKTNE